MKKVLFLVISQLLMFSVHSHEYKHFLDFVSSDFTVSSYLKEGSVEYSAKCLSSNDELPWVPESAENASIVIRNCDTKDIVISSGYVKAGRTDLYEKNSRPKKIVIEYQKSNKKKTVELKDTSEPQRINLFSAAEKSEPVKLIFIENYKGSKYSDLCVNYICKGVGKIKPTESIADIKQLEFSIGDSNSVEPFWETNVKIKIDDNEFLIYNNNGFPEIKINDFIVDLNMQMSYAECIKISRKSPGQFEIVLSCDNQKETHLFSSETFSIQNIKLETSSIKF